MLPKVSSKFNTARLCRYAGVSCYWGVVNMLIQTDKSFDKDIRFSNSKMLHKRNYQDFERYRYILIFTNSEDCVWLDDIIDMATFFCHA